jgi:hypothetical protein
MCHPAIYVIEKNHQCVSVTIWLHLIFLQWQWKSWHDLFTPIMFCLHLLWSVYTYHDLFTSVVLICYIWHDQIPSVTVWLHDNVDDICKDQTWFYHNKWHDNTGHKHSGHTNTLYYKLFIYDCMLKLIVYIWTKCLWNSVQRTWFKINSLTAAVGTLCHMCDSYNCYWSFTINVWHNWDNLYRYWSFTTTNTIQ